jgi:hypothetical protein
MLALERESLEQIFAVWELRIGRLVVGWVTTSEYQLLYAFFPFLFSCHLSIGREESVVLVKDEAKDKEVALKRNDIIGRMLSRRTFEAKADEKRDLLHFTPPMFKPNNLQAPKSQNPSLKHTGRGTNY